MSQESADLLKKALALPEADRAELAGSLIESLETAVDESSEGAWEEEVARRKKELESGAVEPVSLEEVRRRVSSAIE
jgi:putative addiction module component (TIGR02574 family)